jgi:hypothetical protein
MDIDIDFDVSYDLDDVEYVYTGKCMNYCHLYIRSKKTGLRKTSLDLTNETIERVMRKIYKCEYSKNCHEIIKLNHRIRRSFYVYAVDDIVEIYFNDKLCKVDRKELILELDKHFTKENGNEQTYNCKIC